MPRPMPTTGQGSQFRRVTVATAILALSFGAAASAASAAQQGADRPLFLNPGVDLSGPAAGGGRAAAEFQDSDVIVRSRLADVDFSLLGGIEARSADAQAWRPGTTVQLNLFDDAAFVAVLDYAEANPSGSYSWVGHVASDPLSSVSLVVSNGLAVGNVNTNRGMFQIRPAGDTHIVHQTDQSLYPAELEPIPVQPPPGFREPDAATAADDGSQIDMLVVYTPSARLAAGGTAAIEALVDLAITETNTAYANSGITPRLRLVHKAEVPYTEYGGASTFDNALTELRSTTDGIIDNVHTLRDTYGADAVQLLINDGTYCGLAYRMSVQSASFASSAFAVTAYTCATGYYSFGHELGHNQGSHHDHYVVGATTTVYPYSYGYVHLGASAGTSFRTVLAYNNLCSATFGAGCTRIQWFSNPNVNYNGSPTGVPAGQTDPADNHLSIDNTAFTVANFRAEVGVPASGFYVLDGLGGVHEGGGAPVLSPATPYFGFDVAADLELASTGYYVLDGYGGVHAGGGAPVMSPATPFWGWDVARDLELASTGYYVLDSQGGVHHAGGAPVMSPATPYFGFDVAGDLELASTGYYVLDRLGGVHAGGGAGSCHRPHPPGGSTSPATWSLPPAATTFSTAWAACTRAAGRRSCHRRRRTSDSTLPATSSSPLPATTCSTASVAYTTVAARRP